MTSQKAKGQQARIAALIVAGISLTLAGCAYTGISDYASGSSGDTPTSRSAEEAKVRAELLREFGGCDANQLNDFVGQQASNDVIENVERVSGASQVRIIRDGDPVSMNARTDRLNIEIDARRIIRRIYCG